MSFNTEEIRSTVSEILQDAQEKLADNYRENILAGKRSIVKEFLDSLVSCGEMTDVNRRRIEENPELKEFFHQPTDMDLDNDVSDDDADDDDDDDDDDVADDNTSEGQTATG